MGQTGDGVRVWRMFVECLELSSGGLGWMRVEYLESESSGLREGCGLLLARVLGRAPAWATTTSILLC